MYKEAKSVWQYILDNYPGRDECLWAQRDIILSDLVLKNTDAANVGTQALLTKYAGQSGICWAVKDVADSYSKLGQHERARDLYRLGVIGHSDADESIWSLSGLVCESLALKDGATVEACVKKLLSDYASSQTLPVAAIHIGKQLCKAGDSHAQEVFRYVIDKYPSAKQALLARVCMGYVDIMEGHADRAETLYQQIMREHANDRNLAEAVHTMAEGYYEAAVVLQGQVRGRQISETGVSDQVHTLFEKAIAKWGIVINSLPEDQEVTADAYFFTGICHNSLGAYGAAIPFFEKVAREYPAHRWADYALLTMARNLSKMVYQGKLTQQEADCATEPIYRQLVDGYGESPFASIALLELGQIRQRASLEGE